MLKAVFRENDGQRKKQAVSVRELAQWIRDTLMLTLADAVFEREDPDLFPLLARVSPASRAPEPIPHYFDDFPSG